MLRRWAGHVTCQCGEPWAVCFPGSEEWPKRGEQLNLWDLPVAEDPAIYLCIPCAQARGWPNMKGEEVLACVS